MSKQSSSKRVGKLPPRHTFFLNPYKEDRFTRCPECDELMKIRKNPLLVALGPTGLMIFNISGRFCPDCDLLIVHQDIVEEFLITAITQRYRELAGSPYRILGTVERKTWRKSKKQAVGWQEAIENLHDFKEIVEYEIYYAGWEPEEE